MSVLVSASRRIRRSPSLPGASLRLPGCWLALALVLAAPAPANSQALTPIPYDLLPGFCADRVVLGLDLPTSLAFDGGGRLFVGQLNGQVLLIEFDELGAARPPRLFATGFGADTPGTFPGAGENGLVGLALRDDSVYISHAYRISENELRGRVIRLRDTDGDGRADQQEIILDHLPSGMAHQIQSVVFGPDGKMYVSLGDATQPTRTPSLQEPQGSLLRADPDGSDLEIYATGFRNAFDFAFHPANGRLFLADNGILLDELNEVVQGGRYGWPDVFGFPQEGHDSIPPLYVWDPSVAPTGMLFYTERQFPDSYRNSLFTVLFGPTGYPFLLHRGRSVVSFAPSADGQGIVPEPILFADFNVAEVGNPIDIAQGPDGSLYVNDFFRGVVYRFSFMGGIDASGDCSISFSEALFGLAAIIEGAGPSPQALIVSLRKYLLPVLAEEEGPPVPFPTPLASDIPPPGQPVFLEDLQRLIFEPFCSQCHGNRIQMEGLSLLGPGAASRLINVRAAQSGVFEGRGEEPRLLVVPGDAAGSYLYQKITGVQNIFGSTMPFNQPLLPEELRRLVRDWINAGAPSRPSGPPARSGSEAEPTVP